MSWYLIELPDGALTPYVTETDSGTVYGWGEMPKREVDLDELLAVADEIERPYGIPSWAEMEEFARLIRKAVGE